jgi:pilus assembly protein Flp/PilA
MSHSKILLTNLIREEDGQGLAEYGLILGLVSVGAIAVLGALRENLINTFNDITGTLNNATVKKTD